MAKFKLEDGTEVEAFTAEEVQAQIESKTKGLSDKIDQLMDELKPAKRKAQELETEKADLERKRLEDKEEFKTLYEREQQSKKELQDKFELFQDQIAKKDIELNLGELTAQATKDNSRASALKLALQSHAQYKDGAVIYELGGVEVDGSKLLDHYREQFPFMFDGVDSSGGGATGGKGGAKTKKLSEMTATEEALFARENPDEYRKLIGA